MEALAVGRSKDAASTFPCPRSGPAPLAQVCPLTPWEELLCCIVLFFIPGAALWVPLVALVLAGVGIGGLGWTPFAGFTSILAASYVPHPHTCRLNFTH